MEQNTEKKKGMSVDEFVSSPFMPKQERNTSKDSWTFEEFAAQPKIPVKEYKRDEKITADDINLTCKLVEIKKVRNSNNKECFLGRFEFAPGQIKTKWLHEDRELPAIQNSRKNLFVIKLLKNKYLNAVPKDDEVAAFV